MSNQFRFWKRGIPGYPQHKFQAAEMEKLARQSGQSRPASPPPPPRPKS